MKFPKQIYVGVENGGQDIEFLATHESAQDADEAGLKRVAIYTLDRIVLLRRDVDIIELRGRPGRKKV